MSNIEPLKEDLLHRQDECAFLIKYLIGRYEKQENKPFVLNINAEWGYGKTFFLNNLAIELRNKSYSVIEFDAWKSDYTKEPLLAFMAELNSSLESFFTPIHKEATTILKTITKNSLPLLIPILSKKLTCYSLDELTETLMSNETQKDIEDGVASLTTKLAEHALKEHNTIKESIKKFKISMKKLLEHIKTLQDKKLPLFILIDELDRCRPNYAIELLENIKHLFDIEGIYFIIATDSKQLSHSINAIYGANFASEKYLKRFFDQEYSLKIPSTYDYIANFFNESNLLDDEILFSPLESEFYKDKNLKVEIFDILVQFFQLTIRDINQVFTSLVTIRMAWESRYKIHLPYLLFLIMLKHSSDENFKKFIVSKSDTKLFSEILDFEFDKNIGINTHRVSNHSYSPHKVLIFDLLKIYIDLTNGMKYETFYTKRNKDSITLYGKIYGELYAEVKQNHGQGDVETILNQYHNLVLYAGQFA